MDKSVQRLVNVDSFNHDEFSTNFPCKNSTQLFLRRLASRSDKISFPSCYRQEMPIMKCSLKESSIHLFQKTLSERTANGSCRADCTTERNCGFSIFGVQKQHVLRVEQNWYCRTNDQLALSFHKRLRKMKPLPLNSEEYGQTIWLAIEGRHCMEPASWKIISY